MTAALGVGLGAVSAEVYVLGMWALLLGLAAGMSVTLLSLVGGIWSGRSALLVLGLAVSVGWGALQVAEDRTFVEGWRQDYAAARQAAAGVDPGAGLGADEGAFYVDGAEQALDDELLRVVGMNGFGGRWLFRAEAGVRLLGPTDGGRGLPVGRVGAIIWAFLEILLALLVARKLLYRARSLVAERSQSRGLPQES